MQFQFAFGLDLVGDIADEKHDPGRFAPVIDNRRKGQRRIEEIAIPAPHGMLGIDDQSSVFIRVFNELRSLAALFSRFVGQKIEDIAC